MGSCQKVAICIAMLVGTIVVAEPVPGGELHREKRQIERAPFDPLPTFPPDTERTPGGVPIIEGSYLDRADRPAARFFSQFESPYPTTDSEGLRLYEDLWATRGRNQPRSLDSSYPFGENGILPHHRQSAAWSTRKETKRYSSSRSGKSIQTRSGGTLNQDDDLPVELLPSGFGPATGPKFSEEVTYRRSNGGRRGANLQTRSLNSGVPGYTCVTCRRSSSSNGHSGLSHHQLRSLGHNSEEATSSSGAAANSEGLKIYNKWLSQSSLLGGSTANRNQLRSLDTDNEDDLLGEPTSSWPAPDNNGILPHHRKSASWTRREERRHSSRRSSKTISVRSGGGANDLPPIVSTVSSGPQFSEEATYRRNGGGASSNNQLQTRSLDTSASRIRHGGGSTNGLTCVLCRGRGSSSSSSSSHNQLRSLDHTAEQTSSWNRQPPQSIIVPPPVVTTPAPAPVVEGGVQSHTSWSENEERRQHSSRTHSSSGGSTTRHIPSGGEVVITDLENISPPEPEHQSEEITYRREAAGGSGRRAATATAGCLINNGHSSTDTSNTVDSSSRRATNCTRVASSRRRSNGHHSRSEHSSSGAETRSLSTAAEGAASRAGCRRCDTSRVASSNSLRTLDRDGSYPPVQTIGRGDNTVDARILHSSHDENEENAEAASGGESQSSSSGTTQSGGKFKKAYYRRTVFKNYTTGEYPPTIQTWLGDQ